MVAVKREGGFALLELIVAMALASLLALWGASFWMQQAEDAAAAARWVIAHAESLGAAAGRGRRWACECCDAASESALLQARRRR